jgi:hypothetical protein
MYPQYIFMLCSIITDVNVDNIIEWLSTEQQVELLEDIKSGKVRFGMQCMYIWCSNKKISMQHPCGSVLSHILVGRVLETEFHGMALQR